MVPMLFQHMGEKKDDDEFVLQITFTFAKMLSQAPTREALLQGTDVLYYLVDLLQDKNKEVRAYSERAVTCDEQCSLSTMNEKGQANQAMRAPRIDDPAAGAPWRSVSL